MTTSQSDSYLNKKFSHRGPLWRFFSSVSQSNKDSIKNPWFLGLLALMGVFLLVNMVFFAFAVSSNPGLVVNDYYEKGRDYERNVISRLAARNRLHWDTKLDIPELVYTKAAAIYRFSAVDARGLSIDDAEVSINAYRPSNADADFSQRLDRVAPGLYQAKLLFPLPGVWDINLKVLRGEDEFYQNQRIYVQTSIE